MASAANTEKKRSGDCPVSGERLAAQRQHRDGGVERERRLQADCLQALTAQSLALGVARLGDHADGDGAAIGRSVGRAGPASWLA